MADLLSSTLVGFGTILGVELVLTISNVVTSYVLPDGATMEEYLDGKFDWSSALDGVSTTQSKGLGRLHCLCSRDRYRLRCIITNYGDSRVFASQGK